MQFDDDSRRASQVSATRPASESDCSSSASVDALLGVFSMGRSRRSPAPAGYHQMTNITIQPAAPITLPPLYFSGRTANALNGSTSAGGSQQQPAFYTSGISPGGGSGPSLENGVLFSEEMQAELEHCHAKMSPEPDLVARRQLTIVLCLTAVFMVGEFIGGYVANSLSIMNDAAHMLTDFASFVISLAALSLATKPATRRFSFGFYRLEILGAMFSIMVIWILTGILVYLAILRVIHRDFEIEADAMLITSACGVGFNVIMGIVLHSSGAGHLHSHGGGSGHHGHSHGGNGQPHAAAHSHNGDAAVDASRPQSSSFRRRQRRTSLTAYPSEDVSFVNKTKNVNVRAAFIHVLGDFVQSIGVFIAALIIKFQPEWKLADPICTFLFSILVLFTTITVAKDIVLVLMEATPLDVDYASIRLDLQLLDGVKAVHSLHMWSLTMDKAALSVHLAIDPESDALGIMNEAGRMIRTKYNVMFTTVQVEPFISAVMDSCKHCVGPEN